MENQSQARYSPWPHWLAVALALVTFPLIWVGGLVTTYDAGMAVPDWPGTYGYNLLRYPWQTWIAGPWDLFIEHGHRLLGAAAGLLSIALVAVVLLTDRRRWLVAASFGALALVIVQGILGGARVVFDERLVALVHGCVGPVFFAYLAGLVVVTSPWWQATPHVELPAGARFVRAAWLNAGLAYFQLVLGAVVRHIPLASAPGVFRVTLILHLVVAAAVSVHVLAHAARSWRLPREARGLRAFASLLSLLVVLQILLGGATYVAKYAFPAWLSDFSLAANFVVQERGLAQSLITTAHVANGSLILFVAVVAAMRATRLFRCGAGCVARPELWQTRMSAIGGAAA
ncbi:MAG: COX15/CtaA family protein [Planctomycetia bacterium]|nr:COX15/CtaA family protein [Planctomycetia bacterium]